MQLTIKTLLLAALLAGAYVVPAAAQGQTDRDHVPSEERADPLAREKSDIDGNNVRASIFNYGLTGRTGGGRPDEIPYEWPKNTRRHYIALTGVLVGAQVQAENGETIYVVDAPLGRTDPENSSLSWSFEPVPGYAAPAAESIARSDEPGTWPDVWPDKLEDAADPGWSGSWNGFFGKDVFNADQELYYKMSDDQYTKYIKEAATAKYYPDSTDLTRGGLGLLVETRVLAWSQVLINDVVFVIHNVKNDGTKDMRRVGVSLWLADLVGGDGDTSDDQPFYDLLEDVAFMTDRDGVGNQFYQGVQVGAAIATFLETPGNAVDRIDNDGDGTTGDDAMVLVGEPGSPVVSAAMLEGEDALNGIDDNGNGLIDENTTHVPFAAGPGEIEQRGVGYADFIDNDGDGEAGSPVVTQEMAAQAAGDRWGRWPANPDVAAGQRVHLVDVDAEDLGAGFKDGIDNDNSCDQDALILSEQNAPRVTQEMVTAAAADPYGRYAVPGTNVVLYQLGPEDLDRCYADGADNDGDGATDEGVDENIDEMTDESRADGIDNDNDWRPGLDDVGLDGADFSSDPGEGDGKPTTGAGTSLPGEPNIDVTDVSESDQIGITNVQYKAAGSTNFQSDAALFQEFMIPGRFYDPAAITEGDFDLFVSSGLFPLEAGQTERISYAVILGEDARSGSVQQRFRDLLTKRDNALNAYQADYRFAQAPLAPTVTAVPGNGRVTLYWDSEPETSFDSFLDDIGLPANDFEGYRVYRATDPAFLDARVITDGFGNQQFLKPMAQFDLVNGNGGFHPVAVNGTQYYLGNNAQDPGEAGDGLSHVFVDSTAMNGVTYYYAVTAYDYGATGSVEISPSESPIRIRFEADGDVVTGQNVVVVTPTASAAGMVPGALTSDAEGFLPRTKGFTTSRIGYEIVDPTALIEGARYKVVFQDTLIEGTRTSSDTLTTRNFSLIDITDENAPDTLIVRSKAYLPGYEAQVVDGFRLQFFSDLFITPEPSTLNWNDANVYPLAFAPFLSTGFARGLRNPADYRIEVGPDGSGQSVEAELARGDVYPARPTNVRVFNTTTGQEVEYAFVDIIDGAGDGDPKATTPARFEARRETPSRSDAIILIEETASGERGFTWDVRLNFAIEGRTNPDAGDQATVVMRKPFLSTDEFTFTVNRPALDPELAKSQLENVLVVPNPYRGASLFEGVNPYSNGRGEREIRFINLPPHCTIRIFTVSGHLVQVLEHSEGSNETLTPGELLNGEEAWNLETRDNLSVSYGVYLYHVDAPGIGETTGTFSIIK